jgi:hypothetical protein
VTRAEEWNVQTEELAVDVDKRFGLLDSGMMELVKLC